MTSFSFPIGLLAATPRPLEVLISFTMTGNARFCFHTNQLSFDLRYGAAEAANCKMGIV